MLVQSKWNASTHLASEILLRTTTRNAAPASSGGIVSSRNATSSVTSKNRLTATLNTEQDINQIRVQADDLAKRAANQDVPGDMSKAQRNLLLVLQLRRDAIRKISTMMLADGGIGLAFCTATDDGTACAIEYNAVRWGRAALAPQAGVAVYVRGPSGRLSAARIYDDVQPPEGADTAA